MGKHKVSFVFHHRSAEQVASQEVPMEEDDKDLKKKKRIYADEDEDFDEDAEVIDDSDEDYKAWSVLYLLEGRWIKLGCFLEKVYCLAEEIKRVVGVRRGQ